MKLFEFESKRIFKAEGIPVPRGEVVSSSATMSCPKNPVRCRCGPGWPPISVRNARISMVLMVGPSPPMGGCRVSFVKRTKLPTQKSRHAGSVISTGRVPLLDQPLK